MSIIVKGMEMPLNCSMCERWSICECLNDFDDFESICYAVEDGDLVRDKNCPLVEIPIPHGDLVDLSDTVHPNDSMRRMTIDEQLKRTCEGWEGWQHVVIGTERSET